MPAEGNGGSGIPEEATNRAVREMLCRAREAGQFSAAAWAVGTSEGIFSCGELGTPAWDDASPIGPEPLFDLASVTKPIVALAVLRLIDRGALSLDTRVGEVRDGWPDTPMARANLWSLLTHTSGAPGTTPLYRDYPDRASLIEALARLPVTVPGEWRYSSMGFISLGLVAEMASGLSLDELVEREVAQPLGMNDVRYGPVAPGRAVATEDCPWRGHLVRGSVHDENAVVMGGVAGHAGLFGTAGELGKLAAALLRGGLLSPETDRAMRGSIDGRPLGWWPREQCTYLGPGTSASAFGHTGFTGTSLVVDPSEDRWYCLLTNRIHPTRESRGFEDTRVAFHAVAALR